MNDIKEIERACIEFEIGYEILSKEKAIQIIEFVVNKFKVQKITGHLAINTNDSISIPFEKYEFSYANYLNDEPIFLFFDQESTDRNSVIKINSAKKMSVIMENSWGMEYFVTNECFSYLLAVNWYVIEGIGDAKKWMKKLAKG